MLPTTRERNPRPAPTIGFRFVPLFSRTLPEPTAPFRRNEVVSATLDLPGVPEGTKGKVKLVNGFEWRRYWVFFDNGVELGQLDNNDLVRPAHWDDFFTRKAEAEAAAARAAEAAAAGADAAADGAVATATDANDPLAAIRALVPAHLLERSASARTRLGA